MHDINIDLMIEAMAHANGMGNPNITEFELYRGYKEWEKMTELYNEMSELILEGQRRRALDDKQRKMHHKKCH